MLQYIIVGIIVIASAGYLCWRAWRSLSGKGDPCAGCDGCALSDAKRRQAKRSGCERADRERKKKIEEKFGDKE